MSKYQEALDVINQSDDEKFIKDCKAYFEKYKINPVEVIQELVDKEEKPMKVTDIHVDEFYCPKCHSEISHDKYNSEHPKYCEECGQRLDFRLE